MAAFVLDPGHDTEPALHSALCARANARTIVWAGYHLQRWVLNLQAPTERCFRRSSIPPSRSNSAMFGRSAYSGG